MIFKIKKRNEKTDHFLLAEHLLSENDPGQLKALGLTYYQNMDQSKKKI